MQGRKNLFVDKRVDLLSTSPYRLYFADSRPNDVLRITSFHRQAVLDLSNIS